MCGNVQPKHISKGRLFHQVKSKRRLKLFGYSPGNRDSRVENKQLVLIHMK
jgi:hypothetical protein